MSDGFDCTQCGAYANPTVYRPGTPERLRMEATRKCRDCSAGDVLGTDDELPGILDSWDAQERLTAWRDAAVARHLAESGAVHPAVHTPTRIMNYLESHGWNRIESPTKPKGQVFWSRPSPNLKRWICPAGIELDAPLCDDLPNYADIVRVVVNRIAWAESGRIMAPDEAMATVLLEIAQQSDEVAW